MNALRALMVLESHVGGWTIDNSDDYGPHHPFRSECRTAARLLHSLAGAPGFCNYRQLAAWARGDGLDAVVDDRTVAA